MQRHAHEPRVAPHILPLLLPGPPTLRARRCAPATPGPVRGVPPPASPPPSPRPPPPRPPPAAPLLPLPPPAGSPPPPPPPPRPLPVVPPPYFSMMACLNTSRGFESGIVTLSMSSSGCER